MDSRGTTAILVGVLGGAFALPLVVLPTAGNPFGPPKALVLLACATLVLGGIATNERSRQALWTAPAHSWIARTGLLLLALAAITSLTAISPRRALLGGYADYRGLVTLLAACAVGAGALVLVRTQAGARAGGPPDVRSLLARGATVTVWALFALGVAEQAGFATAAYRLPGATRVIATVGNASSLAVYLVMALPLVALCAADDGKPLWQVAALLGLVGGALLLFWTGSRGGWLAAGAGVLAGGGLVLVARAKSSRAAPTASGSRLRWVGPAVVAGALLASLLGALAFAAFSDTRTATIDWRLSVWRSSAELLGKRPIVGAGVDGFRLAYPAVAKPGAFDGRWGYVPTESAHNVFLDAGTALGTVGLLAAAALWLLALFEVSNRAAATRDPSNSAAAVAAALGAALVALQFHYITLDTAPLLAVLFGVAAAWEAGALAESASGAKRSESAAQPGGWVAASPWPTAAIATVAGLATAAFALLVVADARAGAAVEDARAGAPWSATSSALASAAALAPWEPHMDAATAQAAAATIARGFDPQTAIEGTAAIARARSVEPSDTALAWDEANLLFFGAATQRDAAAMQAALSAFDSLAAADPASGMPLAGEGRALLALGQTDRGLTRLERATELSPLYAAAWQDLEAAYEAAGRAEDAARARSRFAELTAGGSGVQSP